MEQVLYYYTSGNIFKKILKKGTIEPDRTEQNNEKEIPTVTFSADPVWEKTRFRVGRLPNKQLVIMNKKLLQKYDGGVFRIVVPAHIAPLDWFGMKEKCGLTSEAIKKIYDFAIDVGARIRDWYATTEAVPEAVWITVEKLNENEEWVELPKEEVLDSEIDESPVVDIPAQE